MADEYFRKIDELASLRYLRIVGDETNLTCKFLKYVGLLKALVSLGLTLWDRADTKDQVREYASSLNRMKTLRRIYIDGADGEPEKMLNIFSALLKEKSWKMTYTSVNGGRYTFLS